MAELVFRTFVGVFEAKIMIISQLKFKLNKKQHVVVLEQPVKVLHRYLQKTNN